MSEEFWLTDRQWQRLAPLLPNKSRGVPRVDDRRVISSIIHVLRSGGRWVDAPASYGPRKTLWIVCSQSPKWQTFSVGAGWDDIANFDVAIGDNDPVDQQLQESTLVVEICIQEAMLKPLAKVHDLGSKLVRRRMLWDSEGTGLAEAPAHLVVDVRRLGSGAASGAVGWFAA